MSKRTMILGTIAAIAVGGFLACSSPAPTAVRLELQAEASWELTAVELAVGEQPSVEVAPAAELLVLLADDRAGVPTTFVLKGRRGAMPWATGAVTVTPERGREVRAAVVMQRLSSPAASFVSAAGTVQSSTYRLEAQVGGNLPPKPAAGATTTLTPVSPIVP